MSYKNSQTRLSKFGFDENKLRRMNKMAKISEKAMEYVPPETRNISELKQIPVDIEIVTEAFTKEDGEEFSIDIIEQDGIKYRVPVSVLKGLKAMLTEKPDLKFFKVNKAGEGMKTNYTVIPLD